MSIVFLGSGEIEIKLEPGLEFEKPILKRKAPPPMVRRPSTSTTTSTNSKKPVKDEYLEPVSKIKN